MTYDQKPEESTRDYYIRKYGLEAVQKANDVHIGENVFMTVKEFEKMQLAAWNKRA